MRKLLLCGALVAATAVPAFAEAQTRCVNPRTNATAGALVGAAGGALVGSQLASRGSRDKGAILGALGGALLGGSIGNSQTRCPDGYYREEGGRYYDNSGAEYHESNYGPPPPQSNYGPPPPPAQYGGPAPRPGYYAPGATYGFWQGAPERLEDRIGFTEAQVRRAANNGWLDRREARRAYGDIANVRNYVSNARNQNGGRLRPEDRRYVEDQLNYISQRVRWEGRN
ncbi:hypothetical protein BH09PSE2_BH09PSE2_03120 [soil metagenome]